MSSKEMNVIWRWKLNGKWDIEARKVLFANIAKTFSYFCDDNDEDLMELLINHLVESLCMDNGFANPYQTLYSRDEYGYFKNVMTLNNKDYFDWKWQYELNKLVITRNEDDLSEYLYSRLIDIMEHNKLSLSFYYGFSHSSEEDDDYMGVLPAEVCQELKLPYCKRIDIRSDNGSILIGDNQTVKNKEFFHDLNDNENEPLLYKYELETYLADISKLNIQHQDLNLIGNGVITKQVSINDDFEICVPLDSVINGSAIFKNDEKGVPEWRLEFVFLESKEAAEKDSFDFAEFDIIKVIPDYDEDAADETTISNDGLEAFLLDSCITVENIYYIVHSFPKFETKHIQISFSDALAFDNKIERCYRGLLTVFSKPNNSNYKVLISGSAINRSVDVLDLFGDMFKSIKSKRVVITNEDETEPKFVRYASCAFNFALDAPENIFKSTINEEDGKDIW